MIIPPDVFSNLDFYADKNPGESWRIHRNGKPMTLKNGKSRWKTCGHAKAALLSHFGDWSISEVISKANGVENPYVQQYGCSSLIKAMIVELEKTKEIEYIKS